MSFSYANDSGDEIKRGMEDLIVDTTSVSYVDGQRGKLYYRGIDIAELATHGTFEETAFLLLTGSLPNYNSLKIFEWSLRNMSKTKEKLIRMIKELPQNSHPLSVLQVGTAALSCLDRSDTHITQDNYFETVIRIIAQTPVILSAAYRNYLGLPFLEPRSDLGFVDNFMYMIFGKIPSKLHSRCIEIAFIIQMDHGFNSSTFTARSVASTLTNFYSAVSGAIGALSGPLHGGASEFVMEMIKEARASGNVEEYIENLLKSGKKVMGMGHRVYKTIDPRAPIFKDLILRVTPEPNANSDFEILSQIEKISHRYFSEKMLPIYTNVDFWSGTLYKSLGILPILYSSIFAIARTVGWCAHIIELRQNNKLYRPEAHYIGKMNEQYTPIEQR